MQNQQSTSSFRSLDSRKHLKEVKLNWKQAFSTDFKEMTRFKLKRPSIFFPTLSSLMSILLCFGPTLPYFNCFCLSVRTALYSCLIECSCSSTQIQFRTIRMDLGHLNISGQVFITSVSPWVLMS